MWCSVECSHAVHFLVSAFHLAGWKHTEIHVVTHTHTQCYLVQTRVIQRRACLVQHLCLAARACLFARLTAQPRCSACCEGGEGAEWVSDWQGARGIFKQVYLTLQVHARML